MTVMIGSARINEKGRISGGAAGDQKQTKIPDYTGEVSMEPFYVWSDGGIRGWVIMRPIKDADAVNIAVSCRTACNNRNIGYDQNKRLEIIERGTAAIVPTSADCSSLVRESVKEATGKDPGNFTTSTEVAALKKTGLFEEPFQYTAKTELCVGDILISGKLPSGTKGHTAIVVEGKARRQDQIIVTYAVGILGQSGMLPAVTDLSDYAGIEGKAINRFAAKVSVGSVKYRLHKKGGGWSSWCWNNAICVLDGPADALTVYYYTPDDYAARYGYRRAKYHTSPLGSKAYYAWQYDDETSGDQDGYAGEMGKAIDKVQLIIV